jgi:2'-5' RNA ligase
MWIEADVRQTGGMIALIPRADYAHQLAVPGGEPPSELHCTLVFLGEDIAIERFPSEELANGCDQLASLYGSIPARVFGQAIFCPDTNDPAAVYLLNDVDNSAKLARIQHEALELSQTLFNLPDQHTPWHAHITASYSGYPGIVGQFTGDIVFDTLALHVRAQVITFPLI